MKRPFEIVPMPASREPRSLLSVDRAISELRRGRMVMVRGHEGQAVLMLAAEAAADAEIARLSETSGSRPRLAITNRRASVLGLHHAGGAVAVLTADGTEAGGTGAGGTGAGGTAGADGGDGLDAGLVSLLSDPLGTGGQDSVSDILARLSLSGAEQFSCDAACVLLAKLARLIPAALVAVINDPTANDLTAWAARHDIAETDAGDVFQHEKTVARTLRAVSEARVPLSDAENTRIVAWRPMDGGIEHLAIIIGEPEPDEPPLTRIHSECFTGDLLASLKCDCGDQLRGAIGEISARGSGLLLYLAQEGRGIGLVNKLRAYELQDQGYDTLDANEQLGFDADERVYLPAAQMLRAMGFYRIRLLTNNPDKITALANCGIDVVERVPHTFPSNKHNEQYLTTKSRRSGHLM